MDSLNKATSSEGACKCQVPDSAARAARPYFSLSFDWGRDRMKNNSLVKLACQVRVALSKNFMDRK